MKPLELQKAIKRKEIAPLYFLYGDESFLLEKTVASLKEELVDPNLITLTLPSSMAAKAPLRTLSECQRPIPSRGVTGW